MQYSVFILAIILFLSGCSAIETLKKDYWKVDEYDEFTIPEAFETLGKNYWGVDDLDSDTRRKSELMAYDKIMATEYKESYEVLIPTIDDALKMSSAYPYIFVNFFPREEESKLVNTTYLVVISRFHKRIMYAGIFIPPKGDPLYRYHEVLKKIQP